MTLISCRQKPVGDTETVMELFFVIYKSRYSHTVFLWSHCSPCIYNRRVKQISPSDATEFTGNVNTFLLHTVWKGNSTILTHSSVLTGLGEDNRICEKNCINAFVAPEGAACNLINHLQWCHLLSGIVGNVGIKFWIAIH